MSFEGYYQCVCKNGHYFEIDVYDDRDKCVDCFQDIIFKNTVDETNCESAGYIRIPTDKSFDVDKKFFEKYLSTNEKIEQFKKRNSELVHYRVFDFEKDEYPLEKIIELFQYFNQNYTLRMDFSMKRDQGNDLVPFVFVSFGQWEILDNDAEYWHVMFMDEYGQLTTEDKGYECCHWSYDWDMRSQVIELYKNMWNRCFNLRFNKNEDIDI